MSLTNNVLLGFPNISEEVMLSGGSWTSSLPLNNLKNRLIRKVARSSDASTSSTKIIIDASEGRQIRLLSLVNHNMSTSARIRVRFSDKSNFSTIDYDSGLVLVWARTFDSVNLAWQAKNFWSGRPFNSDRKFFTPNFVLCLPVEVYSRYILIEIDDRSNPDGYVEIGRLFISKGLQPSINMQEGASLGYESNTEIELSESGSEYFRRREPYRVANFTLANQKGDIALGRIFDAQRRLGLDGEIFFVYNPFDGEDLLRRSFLGRLQELSPLESIFTDRYSVGFQIKEIQ